MKERLPCEFFLIRYVPDVVKGEFVNIGVLLREAAAGAEVRAAGGEVRADGTEQTLAAQVRFTRDWSRVRCIDADADVELLEALEQEISVRLRAGVSATDPKTVMEVLADTLSNSLQMTEASATLAESMPAEMEQLMRMYVEPLKLTRVRTKQERAAGGRAGIAASVRTEFERAGVWALMRKRIGAAMYTRAGDPLRIDCGYRVQFERRVQVERSAPDVAAGDGMIRMFQAVSLEGDVEAAKVLAYSAAQLREGVRRVEGARLELTAVVEPLRMVAEIEDEAWERYRFGVEAMERQEIRVVTLNDLARAAETAKWELRV